MGYGMVKILVFEKSNFLCFRENWKNFLRVEKDKYIIMKIK